jgi:hypothetical protein
MNEPLTPDQRIALIEEIESQDATRRRRALRVTWLSVAIATIALALIVYSAWRELARTEATLRQVEQRREEVASEIDRLTVERTAAEGQLKETQAKLTASLGALGRVSESVRQSVVDQQIASDPRTAELLPRVYIQIVDPGDRAFAVEMSKRFEAAGMIPFSGIELVAQAAGLKISDVRYYKKAEEPGATRIVEILELAGVEARLNYLNMENNKRVRPNHFEVWFAAGTRAKGK